MTPSYRTSSEVHLSESNSCWAYKGNSGHKPNDLKEIHGAEFYHVREVCYKLPRSYKITENKMDEVIGNRRIKEKLRSTSMFLYRFTWCAFSYPPPITAIYSSLYQPTNVMYTYMYTFNRYNKRDLIHLREMTGTRLQQPSALALDRSGHSKDIGVVKHMYLVLGTLQEARTPYPWYYICANHHYQNAFYSYIFSQSNFL